MTSMTWINDASLQAQRASQWATITTISLVFTAMMVLVGALRLWVRRHKLQADDWITLVTMILSFLFNFFTILQTRYGLGLPLDLRPESQLRDFTLYNYAARPFYLWGIAGFKLALCISYLRMTTRSSNKRYRAFIIGVAAFSTLAQTIFVMLNLFGCQPLAKNLNLELPGSCLPYGPVNYVISVVTILCDIVIFLLPLPLILALQLDRGTKIGLTLAFSLGLLTTVCSILRMTQIQKIAYGNGDSSMLVMYSAIELDVGVIVSCLPMLRPLLRQLPRKVRGALSSSTRRRTGEPESSRYQLHSYQTRSKAMRSKMDSSAAARSKNEAWLDETSSERGILDEGEDKHDGIKMTVDIHVDSGSARNQPAQTSPWSHSS